MFNYIFQLVFPEDRNIRQNSISPGIKGALSIVSSKFNLPPDSIHINNSKSVTIDLSKLPPNN